MMFFIGGSVGAAALLGLSTASTASSLNPLHDGAASGFSNGFLFLALPALLTIGLAATLPGAAGTRAREGATTAEELEQTIFGSGEWRPDCSVPWAPSASELVATAERTTG